MATQIVMDRTGDTRHNFDAKNADALVKAEERFRELTGAGFTAAVRTASGVPVGNSILLATDIESGDAPASCERFIA
jgi:hypothetical protein